MVEIEVKDSARFIRRHMNKALRRSYLKALTEPITNSDDSYGRIEKSSPSDLSPKIIRVYASPRKKQFDVLDLAEGISNEEMINLFREYGEEKRTHEMGGRGIFGQGLSDVLFSREEGGWVHSVKDEVYSVAQFKWKKKKENGVLKERRIIRVPGATRADRGARERLRLPEHSGTVVSFKFTEAPFPAKEILIQRLSQFHMLRLINSNSRRKIIVHYADENEEEEHEIRYEFPQGKLIGNLATTMKYDGVDISIGGELYRSDEPLLQREAGEDRQGGLLVFDEEASVLDLTLFGYDEDPLAVRFWGRLSLKGARTLVRKKLQEQDEILTETRDGFVKTHGFYAKLKPIVDEWLKTFIEAERARISQQESALTEKTHQEHRKAFQMLSELNREINQDVTILSPGTGEGGTEEKPKNGIEFANENLTLRKGVRYSVQLRVDARVISPGTIIKITSQNPSLKVKPRKHIVTPLAALPDDEIDRKRIILSCDSVGVNTKVQAKAKSHRAELTALVVEIPRSEELPKIVTLEQPLEFRPSSARRKPGASGTLHLFIDRERIPKASSVLFSCSNDRIRLQSTTVSVSAGSVISDKVSRIDMNFVGYSEGQTGVVKAACGECFAEATVKITSAEGFGDLFVDWDYREIHAVFQAYFEKETGLVILNSTHPVNKQYFGTDKPQAHLAVENQPHCQMLLATLILDVCLWYIYSEAYKNNRLELTDWWEIQRYIEEGKHRLGKEFMSRFLKQPVFAQAHEA